MGPQALADGLEFCVVAVVTQPDRPKGRDLKLQASAVKELALRLNVPVLQPERAREESFIEELRRLEPDLIVVAAYGQLLPKTLLDLPRFGCLNVHTSLLPKYRGPAPIQWAILNGDAQTGITIMKIAPSLDTGDMLAQESTPIGPEDNSATLHDRLATMGADLLVRSIPDYIAGKLVPRVGGVFKDGFNAAFGDGSVRFIKKSIKEDVLRLLVQRNDGQPIPDFDQ